MRRAAGIKKRFAVELIKIPKVCVCAQPHRQDVPPAPKRL